MSERDWVNTLTDILPITRASALRIANEAEAEGYQPIAITIKTTVDISGAVTDNRSQRDS